MPWGKVLVALGVVVLGLVIHTVLSGGEMLRALKEKNKMVDLSGKVAVVVGGTSGIGAGIAVRLAQGGAAVTIVGRSQARADEVLAEMRAATTGSALHAFVPCDVQLISNVREATEKLRASHPRVDYLVSAGAVCVRWWFRKRCWSFRLPAVRRRCDLLYCRFLGGPFLCCCSLSHAHALTLSPPPPTFPDTRGRC